MNNMNIFGLSDLCQVGIIVKDIAKTVETYAELLHIQSPNIFLTETYDTTRAIYRGNPTNARARIAIFKTGQVPLEIIQPVEGPSIWQEFLDTEGEGVHHIAFSVLNTDTTVACFQKKGINVLQQGEFAGGRYTYLDTQPLAGIVIELLEIYKT